ncbi:MAG TPA: class I SAM-dependent methyltransferase [Vicinamibacterales bacterium]|nr:class I SAM-dependent methyltransferase [Vicinamibacterales bacterium]
MDRLLELTYVAERSHFWFIGFRRFVLPWLAVAARGRRDLRLLDCGCGTGSNLALLARHGQAFGFDLSLRGLEFARARGVKRVARASIGAIPFPDAAFDVVTSFDVLYGLPDEVEGAAARELARVVKPGGAVLITVAAFAALRGGHGSLSQEVRRYTVGSLTRLLQGAGLEVERISYTHATLFPLMFLVRTWQRWRGGGQAAVSETEISVPAAPVNAVLSALLTVESWLLRVANLPFGSSVICLARKPL